MFQAQIADNLSSSYAPRLLSPPLTPLPAPIRPERLPSAKVAAVKSAASSLTPTDTSANAVHSTVPFFPQTVNDEQFVDASDQFVFDGSEIIGKEATLSTNSEDGM